MSVKKVGDDPSKVRRITCSKCGSILEYLPTDIESRSKRDYLGDMDTYYYITCPQCKDQVDVDPA